VGRALDKPDARTLLTELYNAAVEAAAPAPVIERALASDRLDEISPWIIALGKAALPMANAAISILERSGLTPAGGVVVTPDEAGLLASSLKTSHPEIAIAFGNHPEPGAGSLEAGVAIGEAARLARTSREVWVLLSGGATSLAASPIDGVSAGDLTTLYNILQGSGLDISAMNTVRKRFSRWGAGRLAVALYPARVRTFVISDVLGDDLAAIGSGPCSPDESTASDVREILCAADVWQRIPEAIRLELDRMERDAFFETPKADNPCFRNVESTIVANNQTALDGAARRARELGVQTVLQKEAISGDAASAGSSLVRAFRDHMAGSDLSASHGSGSCLIAGGETVVRLNATGAAASKQGDATTGGRSQELALSAARALRDTTGGKATLLAAGTDGRDGPTDAAGAIVDETTWDRIRSAGRLPDYDLARHDSYNALLSVGALLKTGPTGTNVADIVIVSQL